MDRLFSYDKQELLTQLGSVENEMREDSYEDDGPELDYFAAHARNHICEIQGYMKKYYKPEACTIHTLMRELYRVAVTGEYMYLQDFEQIGYKNNDFEHFRGERGYFELLYATRLLRYYYLLKEKKHQPRAVWDEVDKMNRMVASMGTLQTPEKKEKAAPREGDVSEAEFMRAFRAHMDKYMIGQDVLKKKLCSVIDLYRYHDARTTLLMIGPTGSGKNHMIETIRSYPNLNLPVVSFDCSSLTPNGFTGNDVSDVFKRVGKYMREFYFGSDAKDEHKCIVYLDEIDKIINFNHDSRGESVNAMVQQQLLSALAGTETIEGVDTGKILFVLGGAFPRIDDLEKENRRNTVGFCTKSTHAIDCKQTLRDQIREIGGEPEFIGRIEEIVKMQKLSREDLKAILLDSHIGVYTRKKEIYEAAGLKLELAGDTVEAILDLIEREDAGARGVINILNQFADTRFFYDMKVYDYDTLRIHKDMLHGAAPIFLKGGERVGKPERNL